MYIFYVYILCYMLAQQFVHVCVSMQRFSLLQCSCKTRQSEDYMQSISSIKKNTVLRFEIIKTKSLVHETKTRLKLLRLLVF